MTIRATLTGPARGPEVVNSLRRWRLCRCGRVGASVQHEDFTAGRQPVSDRTRAAAQAVDEPHGDVENET